MNHRRFPPRSTEESWLLSGFMDIPEFRKMRSISIAFERLFLAQKDPA
jgi:hypothetical protein